MKSYKLQDLKITLDRDGTKKYAKASYPIRYGRYSEMEFGDFLFQFNINGEVKYIAGTGPDWPHPAEWLKRTIGNDWVYYSTGSYYSGVVDLFGEYYMPCPAYSTNTLFKENPFARPGVAAALKKFAELGTHLQGFNKTWEVHRGTELLDFLTLLGNNPVDRLGRKAKQLHGILKARVSVLPPDCRHVDYDVLPLMITDGCLYNCSFCEVKSGMDLSCRTRSEIVTQLHGLKELIGPDLANYNSIYLGQHDALGAEPDDIIYAAQQAFALLEIKNSYMQEPRLFLFGSPESFLGMDESFWKNLNRLPFYTYVNIGIESFDDKTLEILRKPLNSDIMKKAFGRLLEVNRGFQNIEVTANFLLGDDLPPGNIPALVSNINKAVGGVAGKGCIYISPMKGSSNTKKLLEQFRHIKQKISLQTCLYLIQRL